MDAIPIVVYRYAKSTSMQERRSVIEALSKHLKRLVLERSTVYHRN